MASVELCPLHFFCHCCLLLCCCFVATHLGSFIGRYDKGGEKVEHKVDEQDQEHVEEDTTVYVCHQVVIRVNEVKGGVDVVPIEEAEEGLERLIERLKLGMEGPQHHEACQAEGQEEHARAQQELQDLGKGKIQGAIQCLEGKKVSINHSLVKVK